MITTIDGEWGISPDGIALLAQIEPDRVHQWFRENTRYPLRQFNALTDEGISMSTPFYYLEVYIEVVRDLYPSNLDLFAKIGLRRYCEELCRVSHPTDVLTD